MSKRPMLADRLEPDFDLPGKLNPRHRARRTLLISVGAAVLVLFVVGASLLALQPFHHDGSTNHDSTTNSASCVAPALGNHPNPTTPDFGVHSSVGRRTPGSSVEIYGKYYAASCADTGSNGSPVGASHPLTAVVLSFVDRGGRSTQLAVVHPDSAGSFRVQVRLPVDAPAGPAVVRDSVGDQLDVSITAR